MAVPKSKTYKQIIRTRRSVQNKKSFIKNNWTLTKYLNYYKNSEIFSFNKDVSEKRFKMFVLKPAALYSKKVIIVKDKNWLNLSFYLYYYLNQSWYIVKKPNFYLK